MLNCCVIEIANQHILIKKTVNAVNILDIERDNFVLLLSYMTAAFNATQQLYPRLFHIACVTHRLHNCAEKVRSQFYKS